MTENRSRQRWYILALTAATGTFVAAIPFSCMPVLFKEISDDLGLSLVQIGTVWGMASLAGVFVSLLVGLLSDRFNVKIVLAVCSLLVGVTGALRGFSSSFVMLVLFVFMNGIFRSAIPINTTRTIGLWFKGRNLGLASGVGAMGMGLGLMTGPLISETVLSPLLGGWRGVMFFYGALSAFMGILWLIVGKNPPRSEPEHAVVERVPIRRALSELVRIKPLWFIGITLLFRTGSISGMTGYLPLYLRGQGWSPATADSTLAVFYAVSSLCVIPLSALSDRIGSRKGILFVGIFVGMAALSLLPVTGGAAVWVFMAVFGVFMDSFMALMTTLLLETEGVGPSRAGAAIGLVFTISQLGGVVSPPTGNSFASIGAGLPFFFWAALGVGALFTLSMVRETGWRKRATSPVE